MELNTVIKLTAYLYDMNINNAAYIKLRTITTWVKPLDVDGLELSADCRLSKAWSKTTA